jgi:hypothetical protein
MRLSRLSMLLPLALAGLTACAGPPKVPPHVMPRFDVAKCPRPPAVDLTVPLDPNLEALKADITLVSKMLPNAAALRLSLTLRNVGTHGMTIDLPQKAFTLGGFELVNHDCVSVGYTQPAAAKALRYGNAGPMPLGIGDLATLDMALDNLAPGIVLPPGIYAIRLALDLDPVRGGLRGKRVTSEWMTFAVVPPK